jgi:hypothetical protein
MASPTLRLEGERTWCFVLFMCKLPSLSPIHRCYSKTKLFPSRTAKASGISCRGSYCYDINLGQVVLRGPIAKMDNNRYLSYYCGNVAPSHFIIRPQFNETNLVEGGVLPRPASNITVYIFAILNMQRHDVSDLSLGWTACCRTLHLLRSAA